MEKKVGKTARNRSREHTVSHLFSGKNHFFLVESSSGEKYNVSLKVNCDCRYYSVQGSPNGRFCSHILAVLRNILNDEGEEEV